MSDAITAATRDVHPDAAEKPRAVIYRMVMPDHICPFGLKSVWLLKHEGYEVEDHHLTTREETDAFMERHGVETTPQTFIAHERIGGWDDLRAYFGDPQAEAGEDATSYRPVVAIFGVALALALAMQTALGAAAGDTAAEILSWRSVGLFIAFVMVLLGLQKLQDVESFSTMFLNYDLLSRKWVPWSWIYPWLETGAGVLMIAGLLPWLSGPVALFIGLTTGWAVVRAVWIEKRELKCACVGGGSNVPLGFVSFTESALMAVMGGVTIASLFL